MFNNCINLENVNIPYGKKLKPLEKKEHPTTIEEIMKLDKNNKKYKFFLIKILEGIEKGESTLIGPLDTLGRLAETITVVCIRIIKFSFYIRFNS